MTGTITEAAGSPLGLLVIAVERALAVWAAGHAIVHKRDPRSAIAWVGFIWLVPLAGALAYAVLGVNRIRRKAALLRRDLERYQAETRETPCPSGDLARRLPEEKAHLHRLAQLVDKVVQRPLLPGNRVELLVNGDEAYPAMLAAIRQARKTLSLETYIFGKDEVGTEFARALAEAARRGVAVRLLVDAIGTGPLAPETRRMFRREGVQYAHFLRPIASWHLMGMNMRTHRKILVADGRVGFTGGINIRAVHCLQRHPARPAQDLHFLIEGPVVGQLQEAFADDWLFTTGEALRGEGWFPPISAVGDVVARGVTDGPDEDFEKLRWTLLGALSIARESVRIMTPYFLPDPALVSALSVAAMRGVQVDILLPSRVNLPLVLWASRALWWQILEHGCRLWLSPPPFDHSKLMLVDECWTLLGSANWDARSLRLNFEFNVECYDAPLAQRLARHFEIRRLSARQVTLEEVDGRRLPARLRDGLARLLTPYL